MFAKAQRVHFIGIGGIGMSGIAEILLTLGYSVSGSDLKRGPATERLEKLGASVFTGHDAANVVGAGVVVASSAVDARNPEILEALRRKIPVIPRAEMLAELMRLKYGIAVAGMHGKTTTTSMIASVLGAGGLDPTLVVGGRIDALGSNARLGKSQYLVAEADESDRSFLKLSPILAVVTNLDREHMDCYRDMADIEDAFVSFMDRVPFYGAVVACCDDARLAPLLRRVRRRVFTYGHSPRPGDVVGARAPPRGGGGAAPPPPPPPPARAPPRPPPLPAPGCVGSADPVRSRFEVAVDGSVLGPFNLTVAGMHNVLNAAAAAAVGHQLEIPGSRIVEGLEQFRGVDRRFQTKGEARGVTVVDDYGHHPTEIRATLQAAHACGFERVHVIFQPHRFTRTRDLLPEFAEAFQGASTVEVLDIYPASEPPIPGVDAPALVAAAGQTGMEHARSFEEAVRRAASHAVRGDLILTLGAGSIAQVPTLVLAELGKTAVTNVDPIESFSSASA